MQRLFFESTTSKKYHLDKIWNYRIDECNRGIDEKWYETDFGSENEIAGTRILSYSAMKAFCGTRPVFILLQAP